MSEMDLFDETLNVSPKKAGKIIRMEQILSNRSLSTKRDAIFLHVGHTNKEYSRPTGNWCEVLSSSLNSVNPKQALKCGTEKLSQTLNNVKNTFAVFSQRIKKSTKKRQSLINMEFPRSPITPYTRSRTMLGRTPTKLYSPFSIDSPAGKENKSNRFVRDENYLPSSSMRDGKKKLRKNNLDLNVADDENSRNIEEAILSKNLLQTQTGIYEFQFFAKRTAQNNFYN